MERGPKAGWLSGRRLAAFASYVWARFNDDQCLRIAASLSYTTMLSLVPLTAIAFAIFSAFPVFGELQREIQGFVFANFLPSAIDDVQQHLDGFVGKARGLTALGVVGLAVTAMLLLSTIESAMNAIFRVSRPRPLMPRLLVFWAILTVGPVLLGASFSLSTYVYALGEETGLGVLAGPVGPLTRVAPTVLAMAAFAVFYAIIPNRPVRFRHAVVGGVLAGLVFAGLRHGFALYVTAFPAYQTLYGALSAVPMFLIWMYLSWSVVLAGAVVTAALPAWGGGIDGARAEAPGARLMLALRLLAALYAATAAGQGPKRRRLIEVSRADDATVDAMLAGLKRAGYADVTAEGRWLPTRDAERTTLLDVYEALGLAVAVAEPPPAGAEPWQRRAAALVGAGGAAQAEAMRVPLKVLFADEAAERAGAQALPLRRTP